MERLQKIIAKAGLCSRRKAEELIVNGEVKVNGIVVTELGTTVGIKDRVYVYGKEIQSESKVYYVLNKLRNTISANSDDRGRKTVLDLLKDIDKRVFPVGRLDYDTTGVLLLTNDGDLANKLLHPSSKIDKKYIATLEGNFDLKNKSILENGVDIEGKMTNPCKLEIKKHNSEKNKTVVIITINEGMNRQVKKMFEAVGHKVLKLHRDTFAGISSKGLYEGQYRKLTFEEVQNLKSIVE